MWSIAIAGIGMEVDMEVEEDQGRRRMEMWRCTIVTGNFVSEKESANVIGIEVWV
jgi:hypothetical protein